mmetsp:Transcript_2423/g.7133  ORF Transcript_2423/g.7133 Transcript_2423/m.7133 type:complete len:376 (-) Transcript_2423:21-1148(-)
MWRLLSTMLFSATALRTPVQRPHAQRRAASNAALPRAAASVVARRAAASDDALASAAEDVDAIWAFKCTQQGPTRAVMTRENEATHAKLWTRRDWEMHTRKDRWLRVILTWPVSKLARGVAPTVAMLAAWSVVVWNLKLKVTHNGLGFLATPIGLLLAFRVNSCVGRFHAARKAWGHMIYHARDLASTLAASDADAETKAYACRLLTAYAWCAKAFAASDAPEVVRPVLDTLLPAEAEGIAAARKPALAALSRLRKATMGLPFPSHVARSLHTSISELNLLYGSIEATVSTPLAPMYMRHYQRGLLMWLFLLPCGLVGAGCSTAPKLALLVASVAYLMLGIDEIGIQIENPYAVMPVHSLATVLTKDVVEEILTL